MGSGHLDTGRRNDEDSLRHMHGFSSESTEKSAVDG